MARMIIWLLFVLCLATMSSVVVVTFSSMRTIGSQRLGVRPSRRERLAHSGSVSDLHAASLHGAWPLRAATAEDARGGRVEVRVRLQVHRRARSVSDRPRAHSAAARRSRCIVRNGIGGSSRG